jgi:pimeloyl-ACP methyl ester carboxylesterase
MKQPVRQAAAAPFRILVDDADVAALRARLTGTRWPTAIPAAGWAAGTPLDAMDRLVRLWATTFDWRSQEERLNALPQFTASIDGGTVHFLHWRSRRHGALPLVLTHGWPSSFVELVRLAELLSDEFDVVVPSLPGFAFSDERDAATTFMDTHDLWHRLMTDVLGYTRYGAHGGDLGANVTTRLGAFHADSVVGIHLLAVAGPQNVDERELDDDERAYLSSIDAWEADEGAYEHQQSTKPSTLAFGLADSPAGLLAWLVEKYRSWSQDPAAFSSDDILTQASLYWFTGTIASSFRPYYETRAYPRGPLPRVEVPTAVAVFPGDLALPPRRWAERRYEVVRYTRMPRGGHFAAHEEPQLLADDIRAFFRALI